MARRGENIYKRKDGRYEGRYVTGRTADGRTKFGYVYGYKYTAVRNALMMKKMQYMSNRGLCCPRALTLDAWMRRWLDGDVRWRVKPATWQTYERHWRCYLQPELGCMELAHIAPDDVRAMLRALQERGLAHSTMQSALRLLKTAMESAVEEQLIQHNPCRRVRMRPAQPQEQRVLTREEQTRLCSGGADAATLLSLYTGLRLGEVCALQWQDVNWQQGTLSVRRTVQRLRSGEHTALHVGTPKSARSARNIPVPDFLLTLLRKLYESSTSVYLFGQHEQAAEPRTIQRRFTRLIRRLGLKGVHFHTLRHTFATRLVELGVDVKTVSTLLGHSSAQTTLDLYAHSLMEQQRTAMQMLSAVQ